jgi:hypothetical protein
MRKATIQEKGGADVEVIKKVAAEALLERIKK